jgi:steroid delta-isomerase
VPSADAMRSTVDTYLALVASGTAEEIAALYAEDATVEDPVGADLLVGRDAIRDFYKTIEPLECRTTEQYFRAAGDTAVIGFTIVTVFGDMSVEMSPTDIMRFNDDGLITSMRAVWAQDEMITHTA